MIIYLASEYNPQRGYGAYCAFYEHDGQHALRSWRTQQKATDDSLALECAIDSLEQITHAIPITLYTTNHYLLKGCMTHWLERQQKMNSQMAVPHVKLWQYLDRHLIEWQSHGLPLEWQFGTCAYVEKEIKRLMVR